VRRSRSSARRSSDISSLPVGAGSVPRGWSHRRAALRLLAPVAAILALLTGAVIAAAVIRPEPGPVVPPDPARWSRPAADRLALEGLWPELAGADLARNATRADLDRAVGILTGIPSASPNPVAPAPAWVVNRRIADALGLEAERLALQRLGTDDGLRLPLPPNFGSEVLVRELGLVHNHRRDELERSRAEPVRLGNLASMVERALAISDEDRWRLARFRDIVLPAMAPARRAVVVAALSQVGQPYVWGGEWPRPGSPVGRQAHSGFDCSGLAWWALDGARSNAVAPRFTRRTADAMAWERPRQRVPLEELAPGDLVFFGDRGRRSRRGTISHMGIALGNGWMAQSSGSRGGVSVTFLADYWTEGQAFGRRVTELRE
jgi:cell wall-associated NlpC family hydrolase